MMILRTLWDNTGNALRRLLVIAAFVGVPVGIWWAASPLIGSLGMSDDVRWLLNLSVVATMAFGLSAGILVWRDLDREP
jgi:hypothetical protein